jgi:serpin B
MPEWIRRNPGNLFLSPYSISIAMAMTYAGAAGTTQQEMVAALRLPAAESVVHRSNAALRRQMDPADTGTAYRLDVANRLWGQRGYTFLPAFLKTTREFYGSELGSLDFESDPDAARTKINEWIEEQTNGKIEDLLAERTIDRMTTLVLTNAIYFLGTWDATFDSASTRDAPFRLAGGESKSVPMMRQTASFRFAKLDGLSIIELPYKGRDLAMIAILPDSVDGLPSLEAVLSPESLSVWMSSLDNTRVALDLPRFRFTSSFVLNDVLTALGMPSGFNPALADFSRMTGKRELYISLVAHKAFVDVNEKGTEAAAATATVMARVSEMIETPPAFRADHPFIFFIRDARTESILFAGRVADPSV